MSLYKKYLIKDKYTFIIVVNNLKEDGFYCSEKEVQFYTLNIEKQLPVLLRVLSVRLPFGVIIKRFNISSTKSAFNSSIKKLAEADETETLQASLYPSVFLSMAVLVGILVWSLWLKYQDPIF